MKAFIVDSFASELFTGNPAAVCFDDTGLTATVMQSIAQEFNLSETAFLSATQSPDRFSIRFFSPKQEIPLCGHATLASARVVFDLAQRSEVVFVNTERAEIPVRAIGDMLEMTLPAYRTVPAESPAALISALGLSSVINAEYNSETRILLIEIESANELADLRPDFLALQRSHDSINGVLITAKCDSGAHDFHSRYFWPWSGSDEDPVTGGTHTFLAGYWAKRLGKQLMKSFQSSQRGGSMDVELGSGCVKIRASAVIAFEGTMRLPTGQTVGVPMA